MNASTFSPSTTALDSTALALDPQALARLKSSSSGDASQAARAAAKQFEAVFLNMLMKSMRATVPSDSEVSGPNVQFFQNMLDGQMAQTWSQQKGVGLAELMLKQLLPASRQMPAQSDGKDLPLGQASALVAAQVRSVALGLPTAAGALSHPEAPRAVVSPSVLGRATLNSSALPAASVQAVTAGAQKSGLFSSAGEFVQSMGQFAKQAAEMLGVAPSLLVAHAALESGWGRHVPQQEGSSSHNLFGIKAGRSWQGPVAEVWTTEYKNGVPHRQLERFRAYASYEEAFKDYAQLLGNNKRFESIKNLGQDVVQFAQKLQQGGYATDPNYSQKIVQVANSRWLKNLAASF